MNKEPKDEIDQVNFAFVNFLSMLPFVDLGIGFEQPRFPTRKVAGQREKLELRHMSQRSGRWRGAKRLRQRLQRTCPPSRRPVYEGTWPEGLGRGRVHERRGIQRRPANKTVGCGIASAAKDGGAAIKAIYVVGETQATVKRWGIRPTPLRLAEA